MGKELTEQEIDINTRTRVFDVFMGGEDISIPLIQRKCAAGYFTAKRVFESLIEDELIERKNDGLPAYRMK